MRWLLLSAVVGVASGCSLLLGEGLSGEGDPTSSPVDGGGADGAPIVQGGDGSPSGGDGACTTCKSPPVALDTRAWIRDVAADESGVYWGDNDTGDIVGADPDGSRKRILTHSRSAPARVALDALNVYWVTTAQVGSIAKTATEGDPVFFTLPDARLVARSGTDLYVYQDGQTSQKLTRLGPDLASTTTTPMASDLGSLGLKYGQGADLCADAASAFLTIGGNVNRVRSYPRDGGAGSDATPKLGEAYGCALDDGRIYVASRADGVVRSNAKTGGGDVVYVSGGGGAPVAVAVDDVNVYWTDSAGKIFRAPKAGGQAPELVADGQTAPGRIAVNRRAIYWVNDTKTVMMLAKP